MTEPIGSAVRRRPRTIIHMIPPSGIRSSRACTGGPWSPLDPPPNRIRQVTPPRRKSENESRRNRQPTRRPNCPRRPRQSGFGPGEPPQRLSRPSLIAEAVPNSVDGQNVLRISLGRLELAADVFDMRIDCPLVRLERHAVDRIQQLIASK